MKPLPKLIKQMTNPATKEWNTFFSDLFSCKSCIASMVMVLVAVIFWSSSNDNPHNEQTSNKILKAATSEHCLRDSELLSDKAKKQLSSLKNVFHGGHKNPAQMRKLLCMSSETFDRAQARMLFAPEVDRKQLNRIYEQDLMKIFTLRDSDADNIMDYRIKELGVFTANDPDVDNDGITNIHDAMPFDGNAERDAVQNNDNDKDGLANHLDWSNTDYFPNKTAPLIESQARLFNEFGIVLNEGDLEFSASAADMILDVMQVFKAEYEREDFDLRKTFRIVTSGETYDVMPDGDGVLAEVSPVNGRVNIYALAFAGIDKDPGSRIAAFTVMVHEFTHTIQNAMDFLQNEQDLLRFNFHSRPERFASTVSSLGWDLQLKENPKISTRVFVDHGKEPIGAEQLLNGLNIAEISERYHFADNDMRKKQQIRKRYNIVNSYSLTDAREWHAEHVTVTLLTNMYNRLRETHPEGAQGIIDCAQNGMSIEWSGEPYDYENAAPDVVEKITTAMAVGDEVLDQLNNKYLVQPYMEGCE